MAAIYAVYTSPNHAPIPNHLPTLIVTPHGQPSNILYSYLHTNFNSENYLLTPSPQGDLCVAKLFPPSKNGPSNSASASDPGHGSSNSRVVRCEASRNLRWSIANTGVMSPIYKLSLPSPDSADLPLFQISKPNPKSQFWSMFYFAYAGHLIPPKRIEFGRIQKNPPGPGGGGTRITISGRTPEEKAVWQTLGEGNEDCVEWVVLCAALNLLDDEILKAAEKQQPHPPLSAPGHSAPSSKGPSPHPPNQSRPPPPQQSRSHSVPRPQPVPQPGGGIRAPPQGNFPGNPHLHPGSRVPPPGPGAYQRPPPLQGYQGPPPGQSTTPIPRNYGASPRPGGYPGHQQPPQNPNAYPRHI